MNDQTWYIIVNPRAGSGKTLYEWTRASALLDSLHISYTTAYTDHKSHATSLAFDAAAAGYRRFLAVGGDGSVHEVFCGVLSWCEKTGTDPMDFVISVAPIGSGNDWLKSLGIPHDVSAVISMMASGRFSCEDVIRLKGNGGKPFYMANIGGIGVDSQVCELVNRQKESGKRGKMIYLDALMKTLLHLRPMNVQVFADEKEIFCGKCYSIALGNGPYSGGGMCQVPLADIDDGLLDVTLIPVINLKAVVTLIPRLFNKTIHLSPHVVTARCRTLEIVPLDADSLKTIEADGEIEDRLPLRVEVTGQKIRVLSGK